MSLDAEVISAELREAIRGARNKAVRRRFSNYRTRGE